MYQYNTELKLTLTVYIDILPTELDVGFDGKTNVNASYNGQQIPLTDADKEKILEELKQFTAEDF